MGILPLLQQESHGIVGARTNGTINVKGSVRLDFAQAV